LPRSGRANATGRPTRTVPCITNTSDRTELRIDKGDRWAVQSTSRTVRYLDLDRSMLLRAWGPGSLVFPYDGQWVPLVRIASQQGDLGVVRVGDRHECLTDPGGAEGDEYRWWVPRVCVSIERVTADEVPATTAS
jgi:hypothetical protein